MGVQDLQTLLTSGTAVPGGTVPVELLRIARSAAVKQGRGKKQTRGGGGAGGGAGGGDRDVLAAPPAFSLVVDVESCLDRLYGGFYSDWVSGGQWSRMVQFLAVLHQTVQSGNIDVVYFFNGSLETQRLNEWVASQLKARQNVNEVLKHTSAKGTPPPKIWWVPPTCLRTSLRMAMRHLRMTTVCSMDDHRQEAIAYLRENGLNGLVADDAEYAVFDPPKYFSASHLKLTYKGMVETLEYQINELARALDLPREQLCVLAALLGNYLLSEQDLSDFYQRLEVNPSSPAFVKTLASFVKGLPPSSNLDAIATQVLGSLGDKRIAKLKQSIQYYMNGTKDGFLRYCQPTPTADHHPKTKSGDKPAGRVVNGDAVADAEDVDTSKFASETQESEQESLAAYQEATAALNMKPDIVVESATPATATATANGQENGVGIAVGEEEQQHLLNGSDAVNGNQGDSNSCLLSSSNSSTSSSASSPSRHQSRVKVPSLPPVAPEVIRTSSERHQKGLMSPFITQILTQGEMRLPVLLEDERHREVPSIHVFYRPVRQMVYAILFNLHHHKYLATKSKKEKESTEKTEIPQVVIKEWVWSKTNQYETPHLVRAQEIGWGVPTIHKLWFGSTIDDKRRRLRAFLTCMRSDTALMLNPAYVPQHLLVLACVLRYIMSAPEQILREQELDAIIVQAVCPELMNVQYLQDLQLSVVTPRGIQLATLVMAGVETALLVNDACGAPVPWLMCCPWLYLDGKLLQHTLARAAGAKNVRYLCGNRLEQMVKVQKVRQAILEGLSGQFARVPLPMPLASNPNMRMKNVMPVGSGGWNANANANRGGGSRGLLRRPVPSRGGQLEVAGVVVCSWGANYGSRNAANAANAANVHPMGQQSSLVPVPPQVTSVGMRQYNRPPGMLEYGAGAYGAHGPRGRPSFPYRDAAGRGGRGGAAALAGRGRRQQTPKKRNSNSGSGAKKILSSKDNIDKSLPKEKTTEAGDAADADGRTSNCTVDPVNSLAVTAPQESAELASPSDQSDAIKYDKKRGTEGSEKPRQGQGDGEAPVPGAMPGPGLGSGSGSGSEPLNADKEAVFAPL